ESRHYMLSAVARVAHVRTLIEDMSFFVLHAPRQVGKTTSMMALAEELTDSGRYAALVVTCEQGSAFRNDPAMSERAILESWLQTAQELLPPALWPPPVRASAPGNGIRAFLSGWASSCPRPLVLFIDEIDSLENEALITLLRQLRAGFPGRPQHFPQSIALFGMRDVRDYKVASGGSERLNTASPFNVKARSLTLANFTHDEVLRLLRQHTEATGQLFEPEALEAVWGLTRGQPWLTNALANVMVEELVVDRSQSIHVSHVEEAKELLIKRRDTHLDSLGERLREPRVKRIIEPMLAGAHLPELPSDDLRYVVDLGLLERGEGGALQIANPIYAQIIPRELTDGIEASMGAIHPTWLLPAGQLSLEKLQRAFLEFWRQHGTPLLSTAPYAEVAPQLVLMAFLHRVANGGGKVEREYAIGSGRLDLLLELKGVKLAVECKVKRPRRRDPVEEGLLQLDRYLEGLSWPEGWEGSETFQAWLFVTEQKESNPDDEAMPPAPRTEWRLTPEQRKVLVIWG
ncbi:MAG: ATP-binding protein, partial [Myxococcota bacterium]